MSKNNNTAMTTFQFSKIIVITCIILSIIGVVLATGLCVLGLSDIIASAIVGAFGCMGMTSIVWYLKKAQSENTVKIYLNAYKEILALKVKNGEDHVETIEQMEMEMLGKLNNNLHIAMDEANSPIERVDIN